MTEFTFECPECGRISENDSRCIYCGGTKYYCPICDEYISNDEIEVEDECPCCGGELCLKK